MPPKAAFDELTSATEIIAAYSESVTGKIIIIISFSPDGLSLAAASAVIPVVDILVSDAGVMALPDFQLSEDGIEMTFATIHGSRNIFETYQNYQRQHYGHQFSPVRFSDINFSKIPAGISEEERPDLQKTSLLAGQDCSYKSYTDFLSYGHPKTANILNSLSLTQTLEAKYGIGSYAIHPSAVTTNINRHAKSKEIQKALKRVKKLGFETPVKTLDQGVNSSVFSAVGPELPSPGLSRLESKGLYIADCKLDDEQCAGFHRNLEYADKLWALSEEFNVDQRKV